MKRLSLISILATQLLTAKAQNPTSVLEEKGTLPVMFDSVRAIVKNDLVQIGWSNLTEREVEFYMIERSVNGTDFKPIYQQMPSGNLNNKAAYIYTDAKPVDGANFYRIKVAINTGRVVSSRILKAQMGFSNPGITLYPNPVMGDECTISVAALRKGTYTLEVINNAGYPIRQIALNNPANGNGITQALNFPPGMMSGIYVVRVRGEEYLTSQLFIKK